MKLLKKKKKKIQDCSPPRVIAGKQRERIMCEISHKRQSTTTRFHVGEDPEVIKFRQNVAVVGDGRP